MSPQRDELFPMVPRVPGERLTAMLNAFPGADSLRLLQFINQLEAVAFNVSSLIGEAAQHRLKIPETKHLDGRLRIVTSSTVFEELFQTVLELAPDHISQVEAKDFLE